MNFLSLLNLVAVILIPGILNFIQAYYELSDDPVIKSFPFFRPWKSKGFWLWSILQIYFPSLAFYIFSPLNFSSKIDYLVYGKAALFGICFVGIVNATTNLGPIIINVKTHYEFSLKIAYWLIVNEQARESREFWLDFQTELTEKNKNNKQDLIRGLEYVKTCLTEHKKIVIGSSLNDPVSLKGNEPTNSNELINQVEQLKQQVKSERIFIQRNRAEEIITIIKGNIKARDLRDLLKRFDCKGVLNNYSQKLLK